MGRGAREAATQAGAPLPLDVALDAAIAPVCLGGDETVSLFFAVRRHRSALRRIVSSAPEPATPAAARPPLRLTFGEIDLIRRSIDSEQMPAQGSDALVKSDEGSGDPSGVPINEWRSDRQNAVESTIKVFDAATQDRVKLGGYHLGGVWTRTWCRFLYFSMSSYRNMLCIQEHQVGRAWTFAFQPALL